VLQACLLQGSIAAVGGCAWSATDYAYTHQQLQHVLLFPGHGDCGKVAESAQHNGDCVLLARCSL
jgi:hypothetical protein